MLLTIAAAALGLHLDLTSLFSKKSADPVVTCHGAVVSYRFTGAPGTKFEYEGDTYVMPPAGTIELVATKKATGVMANGQLVSLASGPVDDFGTRTVLIPNNAAVVEGSR